MIESIKKYTININSSILMALKSIDFNKKNFIVVLDKNEIVLSVLTDGDIRRALICGKDLNESLNLVIKEGYKYLYVNDNLTKCIDIFKNTAVKFLPIIDEERKLRNIITREQLHSLLLTNINVDLLYDFTQLDDIPIDYEVYGKPWGFYKTTVLNNFYQSKVLCIKPLQKISLQSHFHRDEYWVIVYGKGKIIIDDKIIEASSGSFVKINKRQKHRIINTSNTYNLIFNEVQIGDYLGEDDIIRYEDEYGR